jgi:hypothetical protein
MNKFLASLEITFRRDPTNYRPRVNKRNSVKDKEQKSAYLLHDLSLPWTDSRLQRLATTSSLRRPEGQLQATSEVCGLPTRGCLYSRMDCKFDWVM